MTEEQFQTFRKFNDQGLASEMAELLTENKIDFVVADSTGFDPSFSNSEVGKEFLVKLKKEDFEKANTLLLQLSLKQLDTVDPGYYLFDFTDEELTDIVAKPDEWSQFDYLFAQQLLKNRGKEIKPAHAETLKQQRLYELAKPEHSEMVWIYVGYVFAFLGGLSGVFIGWHLLTLKKTLPDGSWVYGYSASDRQHGNKIFLIGISFFVLWTIVWFMRVVTA